MARLINPGYIPKYNKTEEIKNLKDLNKNKVKTKSFEEVLKGEQGLIFSAHAKKRIENRNIEISNDELDKIKGSVEKLRKKGCKDSIILSNNKAFVVSIKNNTIVTVVDDENLKENIFTNIDSMAMV